MCLDCGCRRPWDDHGDPRHIILPELQDAAQASGVPAMVALGNMLDTAASALDPITVMLSAASKPTLLVDVDDTIAYWTYAMCARQLINPLDSVLTSTQQDVIGQDWGTMNVGDKIMLASAMVMDPQAVFALASLREIGYPIRIWSDRGALLQTVTNRWAEMGYLDLPIETGDVGFKEAQFGLYGPDNPAILIDDREELCAKFKGPGRACILRRWPWTDVSLCPDVRCADSWVDIERALPGIVSPSLDLQPA
jgi:hypothetical protein